ncbi:MAG: 2-hydroxyglutaryl-CoA dehydratase [Ruminococcaceae bacterium]|nr:2-hydroxyglutaryl-CoA dehydratase [Oscillospiraceae bacterium]
MKKQKEMRLGIDIGSTTAKVVLEQDGELLYQCYERHFSQVRQKTTEILYRLREQIGDAPLKVAVSGSAGLGLARAAELPFVQEVFATGETIRRMQPDTNVVVELGGEDAKVIFFDGGTDERMNGTCAGGTGAFIDQMATLLDLTVEEMDALSLTATRLYPIASRCGVFAKTDIQPLLNQGAAKADIAASIFRAVVNQTIAGLAQGRRITGKVMFLGGPLSFNEGLRRQFMEVLKLSPENAVFPPYARVSVALGAAFYASGLSETYSFEELVGRVERSTAQKADTTHLSPLFADEREYETFRRRHAAADVPYTDIATYEGEAYLGIDCGSTTTKLLLMSRDRRILYTYYNSNKGNPVAIVKEQLQEIYRLCGSRIHIAGSAVTGYGEELIRHAFHLDLGLVETMAHFTAARHFDPKVDFILDIGGQDIKCFKIKNGAIDSIMLNEACSSGCGSFIETFAKSLGYEIGDFAKLALYAPAPVDLGSRCTVFMNSSVKQAQKDGATVGDISAGLSASVVKNAIYKVIRAGSAKELGEHIVVQGGTFLNDAVLRCFERELGHPVIRPAIAGLMGAWGAALYAAELCTGTSQMLSAEELSSFTHTSKASICRACTNNCNITINTFGDGERFISGNKCEKGAGKRPSANPLPNLHEYKRNHFASLVPVEGERGFTVGLPLALGMYELGTFWYELFRRLGFGVRFSGFSNRAIYAKGQYSIPSDTACYPAKIMHGHIETLIEAGVDAIFYPSLTRNVNEGVSDNHYNCPVVAYYSELLAHNMDSLSGVRFFYPYLNINNQKELTAELLRFLNAELGGFTKKQVAEAVKAAYAAYDHYMADIRLEGERALDRATTEGKRLMVLCGRPYHIDPEIGHHIDRLATTLGFVVVSEDAVAHLASSPAKVSVLNQWTYHARLYNAAKFVTETPGAELVQLVSFGCGIDAITTDEVRSILEDGGKLYTQIKIDEITNLGAVTIRLRSLLGALAAQEKNAKE